MRTISSTAAAARAARAQADSVIVEVKDAGGTWRDLSTYTGGPNPIQTVTWGETVNDPHRTADVTVRREFFKVSLSPFVTLSPINKGFNPSASSSPLVQVGREFRVKAAVTGADKKPTVADYIIVHHGHIDSVDASGAGGTVRFGGRDLAGRLADQQIKKEYVYALAFDGGLAVPLRPWEPGMVLTTDDYIIAASRGTGESGNNKFFRCTVAGTCGNSEPTWPGSGTVASGTATLLYVGTLTSAGRPVEQVIQNILFTSLGVGDTVMTLQTPVSPGWAIHEFLQSRDNCLAAIRALAIQIGWDVRMKWDNSTTSFKLTLFEPERTKTTADLTFAVGEYNTPSKFETNIDSIRNSWVVKYSDASDLWPDGSPKRKEISVSDSASITKYGELWAEIAEGTASNIDSSTEASKLVNAALADCKEPTAEFGVDIAGGFIWAEVGDLYTFAADGKTFDTDQKLAVVGFSCTYENGKIKTSLEMSGKPTLGFSNWASMVTGRPSARAVAGLINKGNKLTPDLSIYTGTKTVIPVPVPVPGGIDIVLDDSAVNSIRQSMEYEVHVHSSSTTYTPDSTTLKALTKARRITIQGVTGGQTMNVKVVPRMLVNGRIVRGQPSANVATAAGKVTTDILDKTALDVASAADLTSLTTRVAILEAVRAPSNGNFETWDGTDFSYWKATGAAIASGVDTTTSNAGRYAQLASGGFLTSSYFSVPTVLPLTLRWLSQATSTGTAATVYIIWKNASGTIISTTLYGSANHTAANTWQLFTVTVSPPAAAVTAAIQLKYEANAPKFGWVELFGAPSAKPVTASAAVDTNETQSTGAAYGDLATVGPTVSGLIVGASGTVQVTVGCISYKSTNSNTSFMSFEVSNAGGVIQAASDATAALKVGSSTGVNGATYCDATYFVTGLTPGDTITVKAKYHNDGGGTWNFTIRRISVLVWP